MSPLIDTPTLTRIVQRIDPRLKLTKSSIQRGGLSAQVISFEVSHEDGTAQKMLLRVHGESDRIRNPNVARDEFTLLKHLHHAGLPVPEPHLVDDSGELLPIPYIVVEFIEGKTEFSPADPAGYVNQCAQALARIHSTPAHALTFLPDQTRHSQRWINYQPETLDTALDEPRLRETLRQRFPSQPINEKGLIHGDFWSGNLIWRGGKLVGVIDWEDGAIGDPLADLAITRLEMLWIFGEQAMHDFTAAYMATRPATDLTHLPVLELFAALRPAGQIGEWASQWPDVGRPDVTEAILREKHAWFVKQAYARLG